MLLLLASALLLAGCQVLEPRPDETSAEPAAEPEVEQPEHEPARLSTAIDFLQDGNTAEARVILDHYLAASPGHVLAGRLLDQIDQPPETFLGDEFVEITVQPGDTLSGLAAEHAGDGLLFVALARLNGIQRPRLLQPGASVRVPTPTTEVEPVFEPEVDTELTAIAKIESGKTEQGLELLISMARAGGLSSSGKHKLAETGIELSSRELDRGQPDPAAYWLERIQPWVEEIGIQESFKLQQDRIAARQTYESARLAENPSDRHELLLRALELDPDYAAAAHVLGALESELIESYHDQALRAWRQQEVEQAAELWERVLAIDPEFEPARVYLNRAREIMDRLETL